MPNLQRPRHLHHPSSIHGDEATGHSEPIAFHGASPRGLAREFEVSEQRLMKSEFLIPNDAILQQMPGLLRS